jgi:hypothetical protein
MHHGDWNISSFYQLKAPSEISTSVVTRKPLIALKYWYNEMAESSPSCRALSKKGNGEGDTKVSVAAIWCFLVVARKLEEKNELSETALFLSRALQASAMPTLFPKLSRRLQDLGVMPALAILSIAWMTLLPRKRT